MISKVKEEIVSAQLPMLVGLFRVENGFSDDEMKGFSNDELFSKMFVWALATNRIKGIELPQEPEPKKKQKWQQKRKRKKT